VTDLERLFMRESILSPGEREVILRAMLGEETQETASLLHLSAHTIKKRKQAILRKHDAPNMLRASILELFVTGHLVTLPETLLHAVDMLREV